MNARRATVEIPGARVIPIRMKGEAPWRELRIPAWTRMHRPDVLWVPGTIAPRRPGVPTVVTVHDVAPLLFPGSKPPASEQAFRTSIPRSVAAAARVICVSQTTADEVTRLWGVPPERMRVIPCGVDESFVPGDGDAARAEVRRHFGLDGPYVLHVGSLEPRKGLDVLIEAAAGAPWRLVLAGVTSYDGRRIRGAAERVGALLLEGVDDEALLSLYRAAEAVAAPAIYEGFGIVPLEAMACGTPALIAVDAGALEEVSGPAAIRVPERTPEAWRAAVEEAGRRRAELAVTGPAHAARYRWSDVARATRDVLAEAAGLPAGGAPEYALV
jgi:glycosyltransferase involved in cell wall biosynthesis